MKSFSALTLLSAFVLALTTLSSNHNNCSGQRLIQGVRVNQGRENTAAEAGAAGTSAATVEGNDPDLLIPPSFLRRTYYRRLNLINNRNAVLQKRGLLDTLLPPTPHATGKPSFFCYRFYILGGLVCATSSYLPLSQRSVGPSPNSSRFRYGCMHLLAGVPFPNCDTPIPLCGCMRAAVGEESCCISFLKKPWLLAMFNL